MPKEEAGPFDDNRYTLCGEKGRDQRWIKIHRTGGEDADLRHLHLYAAAPDLLEALKEARHCLNMSGNQYPSSVEQEIDAAIAKAEGRED